MSKYLINYEDALRLVKEYKNFNYSKKEYMIDGYKIVTFTYFLCDYDIFSKPLMNSEINGFDMRGTTFVFNKDGSIWKKFMMLPKFFNINQVESTQYDLIKDKTIKTVTYKADGSLIAFMELPNGEIFTKTIGGFSNDQVKEANILLNSDKNIKNFVRKALNEDKTPLFEFVSRYNRIVLQYGAPELIFIGLRDNKSGKYTPAVSLDGIMDANITYNNAYKTANIDELMAEMAVIKDIEGCVIEFDDGQMVKIKSNWYFNMHGLRTENIFREDYVIKNYLEEKIDDLLSQLDPKGDEDAFMFVERVLKAVDNKIIYINKHVLELYSKYVNKYKENWVEFATKEHNTAFFRLVKSKIENSDEFLEEKNIVEYILHKTKRYKEAKFFVDKWSGVSDESISVWKKNR